MCTRYASVCLYVCRYVLNVCMYVDIYVDCTSDAFKKLRRTGTTRIHICMRTLLAYLRIQRVRRRGNAGAFVERGVREGWGNNTNGCFPVETASGGLAWSQHCEGLNKPSRRLKGQNVHTYVYVCKRIKWPENPKMFTVVSSFTFYSFFVYSLVWKQVEDFCSCWQQNCDCGMRCRRSY